jgi:hypothetical protein
VLAILDSFRPYDYLDQYCQLARATWIPHLRHYWQWVRVVVVVVVHEEVNVDVGVDPPWSWHPKQARPTVYRTLGSVDLYCVTVYQEPLVLALVVVALVVVALAVAVFVGDSGHTRMMPWRRKMSLQSL